MPEYVGPSFSSAGSGLYVGPSSSSAELGLIGLPELKLGPTYPWTHGPMDLLLKRFELVEHVLQIRRERRFPLHRPSIDWVFQRELVCVEERAVE